MKKALHRLSLLIAVLAVSLQSFCGVVSPATAQATAIGFFKANAGNNGHGPVNVTLSYTQTAQDGTVVFYVYDLNPGKAFVMISADDHVKPVLAYSLESKFAAPAKGSSVQTWMEHATTHIYQAIQRHAPVNPLITGQWASYAQGIKPASAKSASGVAPLLTTKWNQEPYYNQLCPFNSTDNMRALTGCVATAMAQIMKYWNYPPQGSGYYGYNCVPPNYMYNYGSLSANFGNTTYNWGSMPDTLSGNNTAVATLMYQCGVAVGMQYGDDNQGGSGAYVLRSDVPSTRHSAEMAFANYFNYNFNTLKGVHESNYSPADWLNLIESELNAGHPVQYAGTDPGVGSHTWVCDGYDGNDLLHMNWGWGGLDNGYYNISSLTADNYNFSTNEEALLGIQPPSDISVTASASGTTSCGGSPVTLTAVGSTTGSYSWSPAAGLSCATCATTTASPTATTTYTVTFDSAGFSATSQVMVTVASNTLVVNRVNISNVTQHGAANGSASVQVSGGTPAYTYVWNNEATTSTINHLTPGNYAVTVSDAGGCSITAEANITEPDSSSSTNKAPSTSEGSVHESASRFAGTATMINNGSNIYVQQSALVEVQGDFVNTISNTNGSVSNDGIIELSGNFENDSGAVFHVGTNSASTDRAVKFIGSGKQIIAGSMSKTDSASFYNLVIDMAAASDTVEMQAPLVVQGSLAFGTASVTTTYNPSSLYTNNNKKGVFKTFNDTLGEFLLDIQNGNSDAISGYPVLEINGAPSTGFILTSGLRGSSNGGLQRAITSATSYLYPIGTRDKGFNAAKLNFTEIPGGGSVKAKFCSGSSDPSGFVGSISTYCSGCSSENPAPADSGYNRYFPSNECNNGAPQWLILDHTAENHGYWSFASSNTGYKYDMEVYPNGFPAVDQSAAWRLLKHEASYGVDPSLHATDWRAEIESTVSSVTDLLTYTKNIGCYQGAGVPGGSYTGFSHFTMGMGGIGQALPVQLLSLTATPTGKHHVLVAWATALEINNAGFYVMRSTDGINFSDVGWVVGHDNSTVTNNYTFDDRVPQNTLYYYKLRQVDNNGKFVYSYIVEAQLSDASSTDFALYPNPTSSEIFLDVKNAAEEVKVDMYDISGQLVYNNIFTIAGTGSTQTLTINASSMLPPGTYILNATMNEEKYSAKVILQ